MRRTRVSRPASSKIASANSAQVASPVRCEVPDPEAAGRAAHASPRRGGPRRSEPCAGRPTTADLITFAREFEHRPDEVLPGRAEQPGTAHDPRLLSCRALAEQLRASVRRDRVRRVGLDVRLDLAAVEDVIGGVVNERGAELRDVARAADVDGGRLLRVVLCAVDIRPGGCVENELRSGELGRRKRHVPLGTGQCHRGRETPRASAWPSWPPAPVIRIALWSRSDRIGDVVLQRSATRGSFHGN